MGRSRSSSESSSGSDKSWSKKDKKKDKKSKKDKDHKDKDHKDKKDKKDKEGHSSGIPGAMHHQMPLMPEVHGSGFPQAPGFPQARGADHTGSSHQQAPSGNSPPSSGYRLPLATTSAFPPSQQTGSPPCQDADGSPVFIGSALLENSVHPCKIVPNLAPPCRVPYGGVEYEHHGRYDLLPLDFNTMEFVPTSHGQIPAGRRPIEGGYEDNGEKLYHAVGVVQGVRVPGKTGTHLYGSSILMT
ncbi:hypothetical protein V5O48_016823 [Marasmius crinis-equi]|uniref:Uncharacterized protein n=1 Tax=Marasmius crinis-equi TaxID=585013 RepID=A0ABR3EQX6_9AGAR